MLSTVKRQKIWLVFWILWDAGFFVKNLIEGDLFYMIIFALCACGQFAIYSYGVKTVRKREALEAQIAEDRKRRNKTVEYRL